jgi:hypothetical protein
MGTCLDIPHLVLRRGRRKARFIFMYIDSFDTYVVSIESLEKVEFGIKNDIRN